MSTPENQQVIAELESVRTRLAELELKDRNRARARKRLGVAVAVLTFGFVGTALAANGNCPNSFPFCFAPDSPAQAAQVNHNFSQILEWLEGKVGTRTTTGVQTSTVTATGAISGTSLTTTGNVNVNGNGQIIGTGTGNFHINTMPAGGTLYLNWHSGTNGVIIGNGTSAQSMHLQSNGNINLATVNGRRPAVSNAANCNAGSCAVSCGNGGVIRQAFGIHGNNWNANVGGGWACGTGVQWMGACIGQTSCTVTTGCGTSAIWIDCW